ncbi:glutamate--tRNA ligase [Polymorphobacter fuscus]|uniref:Glutamate--tRNA ligase n=1 Tax=Sandarakinorhabdus fusca TaxID=1439888 RepID=A0A7C9KM01_9SPHN|nr:glutamate--tRNA ligase [Polymorphobacter fuscus]KAB7647400.1 glutamate--tRNA ligase [Polymorphobacter fuscus]MQT16644.1 glutamate--tRNA ligase [Polymorphobacter fuscus]NJC09371.1 glutamyl-tRNA synthetase [Polymorphobacter fuscus]
MIVTRFAPSPTGRLHAGNIRTALVNWLLARKAGGRFLLRLDDTDLARSSAESAASIRDDLAWLGLVPDAEVRQSDRFALYDAALARLAAMGRAYRAYETPAELDLKRRVQQQRGAPPVYDRAALALTDADHQDYAARGLAPVWRFKLDVDAPLRWHDAVRGDCHFDTASLSDPVVRRADGSWLYMLPSVVDDIDLGITDIVRGEDHVTNSAIQIQMFEALGAPVPRLAHLALLTGADAALSKRLGSEGVAAWAAAGIEPVAIAALLARIGTSLPVEPVAAITDLLPGFDLASFGRAPARFDPAELAALNARTLHLLPFGAARDRLPAAMTETAWLAVRGNVATIGEAADWQMVIDGPVATALDADDRDFCRAAADRLSGLDWDGDIWARWVTILKAESGRKGRGLFQPLRQALTGRDHGPEMAALLPLIGQDEALRRLRG